eukprot:CAMPEP_0116837944 /NCGR_PEP_ID=MMETSP0418-20121206/8937_1 /TAXON_ID=1158023 /ORGANISM="Astrosyne radiata, Strain 13vi08-1A" /LENGTH=238 /DNA_ID=CAMNT_0004467889 /DNA_START=61 /DNA_END=777 /DNA_ORIENTATION=-
MDISVLGRMVFSKGVALSEMSEGECVNPAGLPTRLNDGRCDREGKRFICGGCNGFMPGVTLKLYRCEWTDKGGLQHSPILDEIQISNSLCFSSDGDTMYFTNSPTKQINQFRYDKATGGLSEKKQVHMGSLDVFPDGSCVDSEGYIWNAVWRSGSGPAVVNRTDPKTGEIVFTVHMPDSTSQATCCCFGGKDLDVLFITTAAETRDKTTEPHAGAVYAIKLPFRGTLEARFADFSVLS